MQSSGGWHDLVCRNVDANASMQVLTSFSDGPSLFDRGELKKHLYRIYSSLNFKVREWVVLKVHGSSFKVRRDYNHTRSSYYLTERVKE